MTSGMPGTSWSTSTAHGLAYAQEMGNRPQTLYALEDSPVGLAAWMLDHDARSLSLIARVFDGQDRGPDEGRHPRQRHALLVDEDGGLVGAPLLGEQARLLRPERRHATDRGQRLPRRDLRRSAPLGGAGLSEPDPLQPPAEGRPLRRVGAAAALLRGAARDVQVACDDRADDRPRARRVRRWVQLERGSRAPPESGVHGRRTSEPAAWRRRSTPSTSRAWCGRSMDRSSCGALVRRCRHLERRRPERGGAGLRRGVRSRTPTKCSARSPRAQRTAFLCRRWFSGRFLPGAATPGWSSSSTREVPGDVRRRSDDVERPHVMAATQRPIAASAFDESPGRRSGGACPAGRSSPPATRPQARTSSAVWPSARTPIRSSSKGSHVIMVSQPEAVAEHIMKAAEAVAASAA